MLCKYCTSNEDLRWPEPYVKGNRPVRELDGKPHICKENSVIELGQMPPKKDVCNVCFKDIEGHYNHLHKV